MKAEYVIRNYQRIYYRATNCLFYPMRDYYLIILPVTKELQNEEGEVFYLDTGGEMVDCDFFQAKITNSKELFRLLDDNKTWSRISPEIKVQKIKGK
jgi:hypothetical protein